MLNFAIVPVANTVISPPASPIAGAAVIAGRLARLPSELNRYGGEKICPSRWFAAQPSPHAPPPADSTRASLSRSAVEW